MNSLRVFLIVFLTLATSRLIPHPPNFTALIALSFYVPMFYRNGIFVVAISMAITDLIIGYHSMTHWTWGSVFIISVFSNLFIKNIFKRIAGLLTSTVLFFVITNFGVWTLGFYNYTLSGLIKCFTLAIPFYGNTILSTFVYASIIEIFYYLHQKRKLIINKI